jgi:hypothetical protein
MSRHIEQQITMSYNRSVFKSSPYIGLAVVHNHDYREIRRRAFVRELDCKEIGEVGGESGLATSQNIIGEKEIDGGL